MTAVGYVCQRICFCLLSVWLSAFWLNGAEVYPQTICQVKVVSGFLSPFVTMQCFSGAILQKLAILKS